MMRLGRRSVLAAGAAAAGSLVIGGVAFAKSARVDDLLESDALSDEEKAALQAMLEKYEAAQPAEEPAPTEPGFTVIESSWWFEEKYGRAHWVAVLRNDCGDMAYPAQVKATAYDEAGKVAGISDDRNTPLNAGDVCYLTGYIDAKVPPASIEFAPTKPESIGYQSRYDHGTADDYPCGEVSLLPGSMGDQFVVEVENDRDEDVTVRVNIIGRDAEGAIVYFKKDFFDVPANGSDLFGTDVYDHPDPDLAYEAFATPWMP